MEHDCKLFDGNMLNGIFVENKIMTVRVMGKESKYEIKACPLCGKSFSTSEMDKAKIIPYSNNPYDYVKEDNK